MSGSGGSAKTRSGAPVRKNQIISLTAEDLTREGAGVGRYQGFTLFVPGLLPGETAEVLVLQVKKQYGFAKVLQRQSDSPKRTEPDCLYYPKCGGCQLRHMDYEEELSAKYQRVQDALTRLGGWQGRVEEILPAPAVAGYRNKSLHPVDEQGNVGFFGARSHQVEPIDHCLLQQPTANAAARALADWIREYHIPCYREDSHTGLVRHLFTRTNGKGECLVCVIANGHSLPHERELVDSLRAALPGCVGVVLGVNRRRGNAVLGDAFRPLWGSDTLTDTLCGMAFTLSVPSFYQVNRAQAERLYEKAAEYADLHGTETVLDLYCGAGTITSVMARGCARAIGAEIVPQAVANARANARRNGLANVEFLLGDASDMAAKCAREGLRPDVISVDPPRKGLTAEVIDAIAAMAPARVVYVSCDPATLGRDVKLLAAHGYEVQRATAVDMFPRTSHVETVCLFYHQKKDFIFVPYEPKDAEYLKK